MERSGEPCVAEKSDSYVIIGLSDFSTAHMVPFHSTMRSGRNEELGGLLTYVMEDQ
jgi:hypothetical protein